MLLIGGCLFQVCQWMNAQEDMHLVPEDYAVHLDLIAKIRGLNSAQKFFEDLPPKMINPSTCTALLHTYVQHKETVKAENLMENMMECGYMNSPLPYNHMLSLYVSIGQLEKVPEIFQELKKTTKPDVVTYNMMLAMCALQNCMTTAEKLFKELSKAKIEPDLVTYSTLTSMYIKNSLHEKAEFTLKEMEKILHKKDRVAYASLVSFYTALEKKDEVQRVWHKMKKIYGKLNDIEFSCIISSFLKLKRVGRAERIYDQWESISPTKDSSVPNLLLASYINNNTMEKAEALYNRMVEKEIVPGYTTWELLTLGYLKQKQIEKVLECFEKAVTVVKQWDPDAKLLEEVFGVVEELGDVESAEKLLETLRRAGYVTADVYKSLLRTYAKAGKMPLIVAERMKKDNVEVDEETERLLQVTGKVCV